MINKPASVAVVFPPFSKEGQFTVGNDPTVYELSDDAKAAIENDPSLTTQLIAGEMFDRITKNINAIHGDS